MENPRVELMDADLRLVWQRFRGDGTAAQMLRWVNHHLRRGYESQAFEERLVSFKPMSETRSSTSHPSGK